jgi:hypothetical protein
MYPTNPTPKPSMSKLTCLLGIAALCFAAAGCQKAPKLREGWALVSGTVTYKGSPLPGGEVMWCADKDGASIIRGGAIREDGSFALDAPIGKARIAIHNADLKKANSTRYVQIPAKYADPEQSGLTYEAKAGENKDVKLELQ